MLTHHWAVATRCSLAISFGLLVSACNTRDYGVIRNQTPGALVGRQSTSFSQAAFDGDPLQIARLYLRSPEGNLNPGDRVSLQVVAIDKQGRLIDPRQLKLNWESSFPGAFAVDANGRLSITAEAVATIQVTDQLSGLQAKLPLVSASENYDGIPQALRSLQFEMSEQLAGSTGDQVSYRVIARDNQGRLIDPARLNLRWTTPQGELVQIDEKGRVTVLQDQGNAVISVQDAFTGVSTTGLLTVMGKPMAWEDLRVPLTPSLPLPSSQSSSVPPVNNPVPSPAPSSSAPPVIGPVTPAPGNLPGQPTVTQGNPANIAKLMLTPAGVSLRDGQSVQLTVTAIDSDGKVINPSQLNLQWTSSNPSITVDSSGIVRSFATSDTSAQISVSVGGLSATTLVSSRPSSINGGGGGGGGTVPLPLLPPGVTTLTEDADSFIVQLTPATGSRPPTQYEIIVNGQSFVIPAGTTSFSIPSSANLEPGTSYPISVRALDGSGNLSALSNSFGTTLTEDGSPLNLLGGADLFDVLLPVTQNSPLVMSPQNGNHLTVGDTGAEEQRVTLGPTHGSLSFTGTLPADVTLTGTGTSTDPFILTGPASSINTYLPSLVFTPESGYVGLATIFFESVDVSLNRPLNDSDTDIVQISVNSPTPSAPALSFNGQDAVNEPIFTARNAPVVFNGANSGLLGVVDVNGQNQTLTLSPSGGTLSFDALPAGVTLSGSGTSASPFVLTGNPYAVSNALSSLVFTPETNFVGEASLTLSSSDGSLSDSLTVPITVTLPNNHFNGTEAFPSTELQLPMSGSLFFSENTQNALSLNGYSNPATVTLNVAHGTLDLAGGLPPNTTVSGDGTDSITITGPAAAINLLLSTGLTYDPDPGYHGPDAIQFVSTDSSNTDTDEIPIYVSKTPTNTFAGSTSAFPNSGAPLEIAGGTPVVFSAAGGNALTINDDGPTLRTTLNATNGTLSVVGPLPAGVTVSSGSSGSQLILEGPTSLVNDVLNAGLKFTPNLGYIGPAEINVSSSDSMTSDNDQIALNILGLPFNSFGGSSNFSGSVPVRTDTPLSFAESTQNALDVNNYATGTVTVTLTATHGILNLANATGISLSGNNTDTLTLVGPASAIRDALSEQVTFTPESGYTGAATIEISSTNGSVTDTDTLNLEISNPPSNQFDGGAFSSLVMVENTVLTLSDAAGQALQISDDSSSVSVTLTPAEGILKLLELNPAGVTISGTGTPDNPFVLIGAPSDINTFLNTGISFTPNADFTGQASLTVTSNDGSASATNTLNITVIEPPANTSNQETTFPATQQTVIANSPRVFSDANQDGFGIAHFPGTTVTTTLTSTHGTLTLLNATGVTVMGSGTDTVTISGPLSAVDAALGAGVRFTPELNYEGAATLGISSTDGTYSDSDSYQLSVIQQQFNQYNGATDAFPTTSIPLVTNFQTPITFDGTNDKPTLSINAPNNPTVTTTLTPTGGTVSFTGPLPAGVTLSGAGTAASPYVLNGPASAVNQALALVRFTPGSTTSGNANLQITTTDGVFTDTDQIPIFVNKTTLTSPDGAGTLIFNVGRDTIPLEATIDAVAPGTTPRIDYYAVNQNTGQEILLSSVSNPTVGVPQSSSYTPPADINGNGLLDDDGAYQIQTRVVDTVTGQVIATSPTQSVEMVYFGYTIYGIYNQSSKPKIIYKINTNPNNPAIQPGQLIQVGTLPSADTSNAICKHPVTGEVYYLVDGTGELKVWNPSTGATRSIGMSFINSTTTKVTGAPRLAFNANPDGNPLTQDPPRLYGSNNTGLFELNLTTGAATRITTTNTIGGGAFNFSGGGDMTFNPSNGQLLLAVNTNLYQGPVDTAANTANLGLLKNLAADFTNVNGNSNEDFANIPAIGFDTELGTVVLMGSSNPNALGNRSRSFRMNLTTLAVSALAGGANYGTVTVSDMTAAHTN